MMSFPFSFWFPPNSGTLKTSKRKWELKMEKSCYIVGLDWVLQMEKSCYSVVTQPGKSEETM